MGQARKLKSKQNVIYAYIFQYGQIYWTFCYFIWKDPSSFKFPNYLMETQRSNNWTISKIEYSSNNEKKPKQKTENEDFELGQGSECRRHLGIGG